MRISETDAFLQLLHPFGRGMVEASTASMLSMIGTTIALFVACTLCITETTVGRYELHRRLASSPRDDYVRTTGEAFQLKYDNQEDLCVVFVGASSLRESIHGTDEIDAAVQTRIGRPVDVYLLATPNQNYWEDLALAHYIPPDMRGVVVLSVSENRLSRTDDELRDRLANPRLPIDYRMLSGEARRIGQSVPQDDESGFLDYKSFYAERMPFATLRSVFGPIEWENHSYLGLEPIDDARWNREIQKVKSLRLDHFESNADKNLHVIEAFIDRARQASDCQVVLLEAPCNPRFIDEVLGRERHEAFQAEMQEFADEHGVQWWSLNDEVGLKSDDFYDWSHLTDREVVRQYTDVLGSRLANAMRNISIHTSGNTMP